MPPTTELSGGYALALIMQAVKPVLEQWIGPDGPVHDAWIWLVAGLLSLAGYLLHTLLTTAVTGPVLWADAQDSLLSLSAAFAAYHILGQTPR